MAKTGILLQKRKETERKQSMFIEQLFKWCIYSDYKDKDIPQDKKFFADYMKLL